MAGRDGCEQLVGAAARQADRSFQDGAAIVDGSFVPEGAVLVLEGHQLTGLVKASLASGVVQDHQAHKPERLRLIWHQLGEETPQPNGLVAQDRPGSAGHPRWRHIPR